jgi:hypothetical protein
MVLTVNGIDTPLPEMFICSAQVVDYQHESAKPPARESAPSNRLYRHSPVRK